MADRAERPVSRRGLLRALAAAGALGAGTGAGAYGVLADGERFRGLELGAGTLDLEVAAATGSTAWTPDGDDFSPASTAALAFDAVPASGRPSGEAAVALRVCDNPGWVTLRALAVDGDPEFEDRLRLALRFAPDCGGADYPVYEGSLAALLGGPGVPLGAPCTFLGRVEYDDAEDAFTAGGTTVPADDLPAEFDFPGGSVSLDGVERKGDGEVVGVYASSPDGLCRVVVKGGGKQTTPGGGTPDGDESGERTYAVECETAPEMPFQTRTDQSPRRAVSHVDFYACGDPVCVDCAPGCLLVEWTLDDPRGVAGTDVEYRLAFETVQCRHRTTTP